MLLVYTHKITPRLTYIFRHYFVRTLQIPITFTTEVKEFVAHAGPKITYAKAPLGNEFFIRSNPLLFEQGINDIEIEVCSWDNVPCFFSTGENSSIPFDIFAAAFYLITRYEEYLPHVKDSHDRFPAEESLAFKNNFLEKPVVDIWAYKFLEKLKQKFPDFEYQNRTFNQQSVIVVDTAFKYKHKGIIRNIGGFIRDLFTFKFKNVWERVVTIFRITKDPYNTFSLILRLAKRSKIKTKFFFLLADYTTYDKNISVNNTHFISLIKSVADYVKVGLLPSYFSMGKPEKLAKEKIKLEKIINTPVLYSFQYYLRQEMPETYHNLIDLDITEDYSMGYASKVGFRASTCTPFYFYDLDFEIQTPLKIIPFAFLDLSLKRNYSSKEKAMQKIMQLKKEVQQVKGTFVSVFHNKALSENEIWVGWRNIYKKTLET